MNLNSLIPKKININGIEEYIQAAVLVPILNVKNEQYLIFEKRSKNIAQGGEVCFPGGKFDKKFDKNFLETALRETEEELSIERNKIKILGELNTLIAPIGAIIKPYLGIVNIDNISDLNINKNEVEKIFTVPINYLLKNKPKIYEIALKANSQDNKKIIFPAKELGLNKKYHMQWGNFKQKVYVYKYKNEIIWGLTAKIIFDMLKKIY